MVVGGARVSPGQSRSCQLVSRTKLVVTTSGPCAWTCFVSGGSCPAACLEADRCTLSAACGCSCATSLEVRRRACISLCTFKASQLPVKPAAAGRSGDCSKATDHILLPPQLWNRFPNTKLSCIRLQTHDGQVRPRGHGLRLHWDPALERLTCILQLSRKDFRHEASLLLCVSNHHQGCCFSIPEQSSSEYGSSYTISNHGA